MTQSLANAIPVTWCLYLSAWSRLRRTSCRPMTDISMPINAPIVHCVLDETQAMLSRIIGLLHWSLSSTVFHILPCRSAYVTTKLPCGNIEKSFSFDATAKITGHCTLSDSCGPTSVCVLRRESHMHVELMFCIFSNVCCRLHCVV